MASLLVLADSAQAAFPGKNGKIAFSSLATFPASIETIEPDGTGRATLTSGNSPSWSADGAKLAFHRDLYNTPPGTNNSQILVINADGSGERLVTATCGSSCKHFYGGPAWSPDGEWIAITATICGPSTCSSGTYPVPSDGSSSGPGGVSFSTDGGGADWSPDGTRIAFGASVDCYPDVCHPDIYLINVDDSGRTPITSNPARDVSASWSPDGTKIVFSSERSGNGDIYVMNADGSGQTRLTSDPGIDAGPVWSPDGTKIVFTSYYRASHPNTGDIYLMNPDGTGLTNLTKTRDISEGGPDWQPLLGPQRSDYKNAAQFCKAERDFLGDEAFRNRYGGGANAHGKCVSGR